MQLDSAAHACVEISRQIREALRPLHIHYIVHHEGQRNEALVLAGQQILGHPAAETALHILQRPRLSEESCLLGTAASRQSLFWGLASTDALLTLCTVNADQVENLKQLKYTAYHLAWHAMSAFYFYRDTSGGGDRAPEIVVRQRSSLEMAADNLRADIFSAVINAIQGDKDAISNIAHNRAMSAISVRSSHMPEYYPFAMAMEAVEFSYQKLRKKSIPRKRLIPISLQVAREVGKTFDEQSLRNWFGFCEPAQDLAWKGYSKEAILSTAINTSPHTDVRSIGQMVSEITDIKSASLIEIRDHYSPFADNVFNEKLHEKLIDQTFDDIIAQGLKQNSADPFLQMANQQNDRMTQGNVLGWCASSLQAAARAYDQAIAGNKSPEALIRREFQGERKRTTWQTLKALGDVITGHQRQGEIITIRRLSEICGEDRIFRHVENSVQVTLKDPSYQRKLEAAKDIRLQAAPSMSGPAPSGPKPAMSGPAAPAASVGPRLGKTAVVRTAGTQGQAESVKTDKKSDGKKSGDETRK